MIGAPEFAPEQIQELIQEQEELAGSCWLIGKWSPVTKYFASSIRKILSALDPDSRALLL